MKTILHTIDTTGPGGAETVFIDLATKMPDCYRTVVVIRGKGWVYEELQRRGVTPVLMDAKGSFNLKYLLSLRALIKQEKVDLVQSHLLGSSVYSSMAGLLSGVPVVSTFHGEVDIGQNERFKRLKFAAINAGAKHVVAVTDSLAEDIFKRTSLNRKKTSVIYNGIDTKQFELQKSGRLRQKFGWSENDVIVGCLGNIRPAKGYDILLQAASLVKNADTNFRFIIAGQGKGELYDSIMSLRTELGLEDTVYFLGFIDDAAEFLSNLDIFLSSSVSEGLPLSAIQAMSAELPIVATKCGGYTRLINDGENGCLVEVGKPQAIVDGLLRVSAKPDFGARIAANAKQLANEKYSAEAMLAAYEKVYQQIL